MNQPPDIFSSGAVLVPDFVTSAEEDRILQRIGAAVWLTQLSRRVQHYGYVYDYGGGGSHEPAPAFLPWARYMAERMRPHFAGALPEQCIVNEYRPGQGIGMHADHRDFGPVVASLTLAAAWPMRFRPRNSRPYNAGAMPGDQVATLPRRSLLVLAGPARSAWMHGIDRAASAGEAATRLSATFRTLAAAGRP
ncbi:MAG: alpha-ketoglutarate-dependent dioxygenase AlkB [Defluviicoccus sp.]|nr:alpha-ketoglutarate-dependent dioxygenase AlkB [Defluviicoccus sp.]MDE0274584.1 alpha-ketoglutarate-dependent dioxygenase AlkB [Defluviicoccus sp.]